jgi:DNA modification methylase
VKSPTHIKDLVPDPENRRKHNPRNLGMVVDALQHVGAARSIVIDEKNVILAGNGVTEAAGEAGITKVRVIDAAGDELIAVRRSGLTSDQKRALAIYDNRTGELATWNVEQLAADQAAGLDLKAFFSAEETAELLSLIKSGTAGKTDENEIPAERPTDIVAGDMFELGSHRIVCGDSTDADVVSRVLAGAKPSLMVTDPPYGVEYDPGWRAAAGVNKSKKKMGVVENDDRADWTEVWRLFPGSVAYVWHAGLKADVVKASLEMAGFGMRSQIIWAKDRLVLSRGDYHWQHEPCWYAVRAGAAGQRTPDRSQATLWRIPVPKNGERPAADTSTVWEIPSRDDCGHGHGTQKPVECMARPMRNHRAPQVFEPFSGSGSTIIAAETLGRSCYAVELKPGYVQIAIDRWEAFTGRTAVKAGEAVRA